MYDERMRRIFFELALNFLSKNGDSGEILDEPTAIEEELALMKQQNSHLMAKLDEALSRNISHEGLIRGFQGTIASVEATIKETFKGPNR